MKYRRLIKWFLVISWMIIIFILSSEPNSGTHTYNIIGKIFPNIKESTVIETINFCIRKGAHFIEYFILSILVYTLLKEYTKEKKKTILLCIIICFLYSITDEFHQSFIPGRTGIFTDCLVDTSGSITYIALNIFYNKKLSQKR